MTDLESKNKRRMRTYIEAWNDHDIEVIAEFFAEDCEGFTPEQVREICEGWFSAFPDLHHDIQELAVDGQWVLGRATLTGTHEGEYKGLPATGTEIKVDDHFSTKFEDGKIAEHNAIADQYSLLRQLDVTLPPESTREAENKALVRRYLNALNDRDKDAFRATLADNFTYGEVKGPDEMVEREWGWLKAFDLQWDIEAMYADGDVVTTRVIASGTHCGEHLGLEPTGNSFEVTATTVTRVSEGKVAEWWGEWDFAGLLNQINAIDSPVYGE